MKSVWNAGVCVVAGMAVLVAGAIPALAQPVISAKAGTVSYVMGKVTVAGEEVQPSETKLPEVQENAVLATEDGRAEVTLTMGVFIRTGDHASFKMLTNRLIDTRLELLTGSHIVEASDIQKDNNLTITAKDATVVINKRGIYRFDLEQSQIKVFDGLLGVQVNGQNMLVGPGKMLDLSGATPSVEKFDKETTDALDHWARRRAEQSALANASSAKQVHDYGCDTVTSGRGTVTNFAAANNANVGSPCYNPCNSFRYNPWFGSVTYIPCNGNVYSPYGYRYWSPFNVMQAYYMPPVFRGGNNNGGGGFGTSTAARGVGQTSAGYSGVMASPAASSASSPTSAGMSGTSVSSSAGSASGGHGAAGGHGK
jgi:hypothetical protein